MYLNKRGTYGIASAAYLGGRLGVALHQGLVYGWSNTVNAYALLFADDWWFSASGQDFMETLLGTVLYLKVFGVPISYEKITGGLVLVWIGYEIEFRSYNLCVSERRAAWLKG